MGSDRGVVGQGNGAVARVGAVEVVVLHRDLGADPLTAALEAVQRAGTDPAVLSLALLLIGRGDDPSEATEAFAEALRGFDKPVVIGVSNLCCSAWLAVALAADRLLCDVATRFSVEDVAIGLVPGGGVTQALPRRLGTAQALRLMLDGAEIGAAEAIALGLVDRVVEGDLPAAVVAEADQLRPPAAPRPAVAQDPMVGQRAVDEARAALIGAVLPAPGRIVDCVEAAALLPPDQGLAYEAAARADLAEGALAAGLGHARRVDRRLAALLPEPAWPPLQAVSIWGSGGRADVLVRRALRAGLRVALCEGEREALIATLERIAAAQETDVLAGRLTAEERDADWARLTPWLDPVADGTVLICPSGEGWLAELAPGQAAISAEAATPAGLPKLNFLSAGGAELAFATPAAMAVVQMLGLQVLPTRATAPLARRLRGALAAAITWQEAAGVPRSLIAQALARRGFIGGKAQPQTLPMPPEESEPMQRMIGAVLVAGAQMLDRAEVASPAVVDGLCLAAGLFPRWFGGPLFQADRRGLLLWCRDLREWAAEAPQIWAPPPLMDRLLAEGRSFADLDVISG